MEPLPLFVGDGTDATLFSSLWSFQEDLHQQPQEVTPHPIFFIFLMLQTNSCISWQQWLAEFACPLLGALQGILRAHFSFTVVKGVRQAANWEGLFT